MKIRINERETYELQINEAYNKEITWQNFLEMTERINRIVKIFQKDAIVLNPSEEATSKVPLSLPTTRKIINKRAWCDTREKCIEILRIHYTRPYIERVAYGKFKGFNWDKEARPAIYAFKVRFKIKPSDIGLSSWKRYDGTNN